MLCFSEGLGNNNCMQIDHNVVAVHNIHILLCDIPGTLGLRAGSVDQPRVQQGNSEGEHLP